MATREGGSDSGKARLTWRIRAAASVGAEPSADGRRIVVTVEQARKAGAWVDQDQFTFPPDLYIQINVSKARPEEMIGIERDKNNQGGRRCGGATASEDDQRPDPRLVPRGGSAGSHPENKHPSRCDHRSRQVDGRG